MPLEDGLGEGDGVPIPPAKAGAAANTTSATASAYDLKEKPPMIASCFSMYASARGADYSGLTKATLQSWH